MSLWRRTSSELAGTWRSLRYDMGRRPAEPPASGPDVTSTGMNTFGGTVWGYEPAPVVAPARRPARRAALVSALGLLTVLGAAGAYLFVVTGLVPMRDEKPAAAGTLPAVVAPAVSAESRIGPSMPLPRRHAAPDPAVPALEAPPVAAAPPPTAASPVRTVKPSSRECRCGNPPVPTPTAPASAPSPTPSASTSASASATASPSGENSSGSPEPSFSRQAGHHRRRH